MKHEINNVSYKNLTECIYEELKAEILKGKLLPGTKLTEMSIAEKLNASRTPIRAALKKLEEEHLVECEKFKGVRVSNVDVRDLIDALEIRESMEGTIAYHASKRISEENKERLKQAHFCYNKAVIEGDNVNIINWDAKFHKIIVDSTENIVMIKMSEELKDLMVRFRHLYYGNFSRAEKVGREHEQILETILNGDCNKAKEIASKHIRSLRQDVIDEYEENKNIEAY